MASNFTSTSAAGGGGGGGRGGGTSAFKMHVTPENTGLWGIRQTEEAAKKVTELLQEDMEHHHVFFNKDHFHNHIPHHLLALYGTHCTSPALLQTAYNNNTSYQRPALSPHEPPSPPSSSPESKPLLISPSDPWPSSALKYLGNETYYPDFLLFFQTELDKHGPQHVLTKYLFDDDQQMLPRLWSGVLHPLIQLMYGVEFSQPAIIAEALAQTAVHSNQLVDYLHSSESRSLSSRSSGGQNPGPMPAILDLLSEIRNHPTLSKAARPSDDQKIFDGVLGRAKEDMIALAAKVRVAEDEVEERTAEMFHEAVYVASVAARSGNLKWGKESSKFDFFLMHHVNSSPIFAEIANNQSWIPAKTKARLLEWKIRMDLLQYAARGCPELFGVDALNDYKPKHAKEGETVEDIISRLHKFPDDGHSIKLGRAAVICRNVCKKYEDEGKDWLRIKGEETWKKVCHLIVDSVEAPGDTWVRSAGFEEAWKDIADAKL